MEEINDIIMGLDVSTKCIGVTIARYDGKNLSVQLVTHFRPKIPTKIKGTEALFLKSRLFEDEIQKFKDYGITKVVIEEPLIASNNSMTASTLLRYNGMISQSIYDKIGVIPEYISSYDARRYGFPELNSVRKYKKNGDVYDEKKIKSDLKHNKVVTFGEYPWDCEKKFILWNKVCELFPNIQWVYDKNGELKNENFDASDSFVCVIGWVKKNMYNGEDPKLSDIEEIKGENGNNVGYRYKLNFCGCEFDKEIYFE